MKRLLFATTILLAAALGLAQTAKSVRVDVSGDKAGAEPVHFLGVVGHWTVVEDGGKNVRMEDVRV